MESQIIIQSLLFMNNPYYNPIRKKTISKKVRGIETQMCTKRVLLAYQASQEPKGYDLSNIISKNFHFVYKLRTREKAKISKEELERRQRPQNNPIQETRGKTNI